MSSFVLWKLDPSLSPAQESPPVYLHGEMALTTSERAELRKKRRAGGLRRGGR